MSIANSRPRGPWRPDSPRRGAVELIASTQDLLALELSWRDLWRRARASPLLSPDWLLPWWRHVPQGDLTTVAVWEEDRQRLAALAPLYVWRDPATGTRHLFPLGIATSDRVDVLVAPDARDLARHAIVSQLRACSDRWDLFEAGPIAAHAALPELAWPSDWHTVVNAGEANPVLALPARLPQGMRKALAYARRRAAHECSVTFELVDATALPQALADLERLHAGRWSLRGERGVLAQPGMFEWHRECAPRLQAAGLLRMLSLRFDGEVAAVLHCVADGAHVPTRRWSYYIGGFDPRHRALSPGMLAIGHAIDLATSEGAVIFDFLRGGEAYKYRWGAVDEPMQTLLVRPTDRE